MPNLSENDPEEGRGELFSLIIGFLLAIYGFLALVAPERYPINGIPTQYSSLVGLALLGVGMYLILKRRRE